MPSPLSECGLSTGSVELDSGNWASGVEVTVTAYDDPVADGPVIQRASQQALQHGVLHEIAGHRFLGTTLVKRDTGKGQLAVGLEERANGHCLWGCRDHRAGRHHVAYRHRVEFEQVLDDLGLPGIDVAFLDADLGHGQKFGMGVNAFLGIAFHQARDQLAQPDERVKQHDHQRDRAHGEWRQALPVRAVVRRGADADDQDADRPGFIHWEDIDSLVGSITSRSLVARPRTVDECREALEYFRQRGMTVCARGAVWPSWPGEVRTMNDPKHDLPPSLYLWGKPAFLGAKPWPLTGGDLAPGGDTLPAQDRYDNL